MKWFRLLAASSVLACFGGAVCGQESREAAPAKPPSLEGVKWRGPAPSLEALKGKTVVLLVYATWCPICNKWSPDFFHQLHDAIHGKPVVVLAVNADSSPTDVQAYLTERGFFAPNIIHGYDPTIATRLGFQSELYQYVWIEPDGKASKRGQAGSFYERPQGKQFVLASEILTRKDLGQFKILDPQMSPAVFTALWPMELGDLSEAAARKAKTPLAAAQKAEVDAAVAKSLSAQLAEIRGLYKGSVAEKLQAHEKAVALSKVFKQSAASKKAKAVVAFLEADKDFARELAAKKAYDSCMQRSTATPRARATALRGIAERFEGTHYGELAKEVAAKKS
jgi:thiol-disulfide isomerase/thioredoxin